MEGHLLARSLGGTTDLTNMIPLSPPANRHMYTQFEKVLFSSVKNFGPVVYNGIAHYGDATCDNRYKCTALGLTLQALCNDSA